MILTIYMNSWEALINKLTYDQHIVYKQKSGLRQVGPKRGKHSLKGCLYVHVCACWYGRGPHTPDSTDRALAAS